MNKQGIIFCEFVSIKSLCNVIHYRYCGTLYLVAESKILIVLK